MHVRSLPLPHPLSLRLAGRVARRTLHLRESEDGGCCAVSRRRPTHAGRAPLFGFVPTRPGQRINLKKKKIFSMPCNVDVHATYHMVGAVSPIRAEATLQIEMDRRQGRAALSHDRQSRRVSDKPKPRSWCTVYVYVCTSCA